MPYVTIRSYQVSFMLLLLLIAGILAPAVALTYLWATRTTTYVIEEPLSITSYPTAISTNPGENTTLNIVIENSANIDYTVLLNFMINDTVYQQTYMQFSNLTYTVDPGSNNVTAWCFTAKKSPPAQLTLTIEFRRE